MHCNELFVLVIDMDLFYKNDVCLTYYLLQSSIELGHKSKKKILCICNVYLFNLTVYLNVELNYFIVLNFSAKEAFSPSSRAKENSNHTTLFFEASRI